MIPEFPVLVSVNWWLFELLVCQLPPSAFRGDAWHLRGLRAGQSTEGTFLTRKGHP